MAKVFFTQNLQRHLDAAPREVAGGDVRAVLEAVFRQQPRLRGYILDDQSRLRSHVVVFVDGQAVKDKASLSDPVSAASEVYVMQALSGG